MGKEPVGQALLLFEETRKHKDDTELCCDRMRLELWGNVYFLMGHEILQGLSTVFMETPPEDSKRGLLTLQGELKLGSQNDLWKF